MGKEIRQSCKQDGTPWRLLFIGNSATYVHELPQMLSYLAGEVGYKIEVERLTPGGYTLAQHADASTEHGQRVLEKIREGFDVVFLQDNGNCVSDDDFRNASRNACDTLVREIRKSGAEPWFYVRPPYGYEAFGRSPYEQCRAFDELFSPIAEQLEMNCAYVNRAFARAIESLPYDLWGKDHGHTSEHGAYLAVCVFFASLFGKTATQLPAYEVFVQDAARLQAVADSIALDGVIPWESRESGC